MTMLPQRFPYIIAFQAGAVNKSERIFRCHFLSGGQYGRPRGAAVRPENGKAKDLTQRIHILLYPYNELPEAEKEKDRENIRVLLSIK